MKKEKVVASLMIGLFCLTTLASIAGVLAYLLLRAYFIAAGYVALASLGGMVALSLFIRKSDLKADRDLIRHASNSINKHLK
jgi:hypothetical protein